VVELCTAIHATIIRHQEMVGRLRKSKSVIRLVALPSSWWSACSAHQDDAVTSDEQNPNSKIGAENQRSFNIRMCMKQYRIIVARKKSVGNPVMGTLTAS
jgi:hypothetical protein